MMAAQQVLEPTTEDLVVVEQEDADRGLGGLRQRAMLYPPSYGGSGRRLLCADLHKHESRRADSNREPPDYKCGLVGVEQFRSVLREP